MAFFSRNNPEVIRDSIDLTVEEFVAKYRPLTNEEVLSKAYLEIKRKEQLKNPQPVIQAKVIKTNFPKPLVKAVTFKVNHTMPEPDEELPVKESIPIIKETIFGGKVEPITDLGISHEKQIENDMLVAANTVDMNNIKKKRGKQPAANSSDRDVRILELLEAGKKGTEIIKIMKNEGFKVHAPQISAIKALMDAE